MADITIPDAAVEAAARAYFHSYYDRGSSSIQAHRAALTAAAPHIAARALREAAAALVTGNAIAPADVLVSRWLIDRADEIEADHG